METTSKRANGAGNRLDQLEKDMLEIAKKMGQSATTRENAAKREEVLKKKLQQVNKQLLEAESRAAYMEEERNKLDRKMLKEILMGLLGICIIITLFFFFLSIKIWIYGFM